MDCQPGNTRDRNIDPFIGGNAHLLHMHDLISDSPTKDGPFDNFCGYRNSIDTVTSDIAARIDQLAEMDLAVLNSNEPNQVCPGWHFGLWS